MKPETIATDFVGLLTGAFFDGGVEGFHPPKDTKFLLGNTPEGVSVGWGFEYRGLEYADKSELRFSAFDSLDGFCDGLRHTVETAAAQCVLSRILMVAKNFK